MNASFAGNSFEKLNIAWRDAYLDPWLARACARRVGAESRERKQKPLLIQRPVRSWNFCARVEKKGGDFWEMNRGESRRGCIR